jgi:hypothetical protein
MWMWSPPLEDIMNVQSFTRLLLIGVTALLTLAFAAHALTTLPTTLVGKVVVRAPIRGCRTAREVASTVGLRISLNTDRWGRLRVYVDPASRTTVRDGRLGDALVSADVRPLVVVDNGAYLHNAVAPYVSGMVAARVNLPC